MKTFAYRGFDASGTLRRGLVEAMDLRDARARLAQQGVLPESVDPVQMTSRGDARLPDRLRAQLYGEWGSLLLAGIPIIHAVDVMAGALHDPSAVRAWAAVRDRLREGSRVAEALSTVYPQLPDYEKAVIESGERTGRLGEVLEGLAAHIEEEVAAREKIVSALIYPAFVIALAIVIAVAMLGFVLPSMKSMFTGAPGQMTPADGPAYGLITLMAAAAGIALAWIYRLRVKRDPEAMSAWHHRFLQVRWLGSSWSTLLAARFADALALMLRGGVQMIDAVPLAGSTTGNLWIKRSMGAAADEIRQGQSLSHALQAVPHIAAHLAGWVAAGEVSGDLPRMLDAAAQKLSRDWNRRVARFLTLLQPTLIVLIGAMVFVLAKFFLDGISAMQEQMMQVGGK